MSKIAEKPSESKSHIDRPTPGDSLLKVGDVPGPLDCFVQLSPYVLDLPWGHPVRWAFANAERIFEAEQENEERDFPHLKPAIEKALRAFAAMPEEERTSVLNGWKMPAEMMAAQWPPEEWYRYRSSLSPMVIAWQGDRSDHGPPNQKYQVIDSGTNARVGAVLEPGIRKMDAVDSLHRLADRLECHWETFVAAQEGRDPPIRPAASVARPIDEYDAWKSTAVAQPAAEVSSEVPTPNALPHKDPPDPFDPPEQDDALDTEYWDAWSQYEELRDAVFENFPFVHPVRDAFFYCRTELDLHPNRRAVRRALDLYYALSESSRKLATHGWNFVKPNIDAGRERLLYDAKFSPLKHGIVFHIGDETHQQVEMSCGLQSYITESNYPVEVTVRVATPKMVAVNALRNLADDLERQWDAIVGEKRVCDK